MNAPLPLNRSRGRRRVRWWWIVGGLGLVLAVGVLWPSIAWWRLPPGIKQDIRAGMAARDIRDPRERLEVYLETRYGSLEDAGNRQDAFLDFFNVEHIDALQLMVRHSPADQRQANIDAMTKWLQRYRETMTPQEKAALRQRFEQAGGRQLLMQARGHYNRQDVYYRGQTAPVISELLKTIHSLEFRE